MTLPDETEKRVQMYVRQRNIQLVTLLGVGTQGIVYLCNNPSLSQRVAIKFHEREIAYRRERDVYRRLREFEVVTVCGHQVPQLIDFDDRLLAIEMTIVSPPFFLDFGGAYLDRAPDYSAEVWADWRAQKSDAFEENWPAVQRMIEEFKTYGVFVADVNPANVQF